MGAPYSDIGTDDLGEPSSSHQPCGMITQMSGVGSDIRNPRWLTKRVSIVILVLTYLSLALTFGLMTRAWEADDEPAHTQYVEYIVQHNSLPRIGVENGLESHQPPLYYLLEAGWQRVLGIPAFTPTIIALPSKDLFATDTLPYGHDYTPTEHRDAVDLRWLRLISITLGLGTVLLGYAVAKVIGIRESAALGVGLFIALLPRELVVSSSVTNDALVIPLCALALLLFLLAERNRTTGLRGRRTTQVLGMGLTLGAAAITKFNSLPVAAVLILLALVPSIRLSRQEPEGTSLETPGSIAFDQIPADSEPEVRADHRGPAVDWRVVMDGVIAIAAFLAVSGWWFLRNQRLYGQYLATRAGEKYLSTFYLHPVKWSVSMFTNELPTTFQSSMWYLQPKLVLPGWMNDALGVLALVSLVGGVWMMLAKRIWFRPRLRILPALAVLGCVAGGVVAVVLIIKSVGYSDARLSYVALSAVAVLLVVGGVRIASLIDGRVEAISPLFWPAVLLAVDLFVLGRFLIPLGGL